MTLKELQDILELLKKYPVSKIKYNGIELELDHKLNSTSLGEQIKSERMPTEDEYLFMSSSYIPEVDIEKDPDNHHLA